MGYKKMHLDINLQKKMLTEMHLKLYCATVLKTCSLFWQPQIKKK